VSDKTVILFHKGCPDGWGSAWWLNHCLLGARPQVEVEMIGMDWHHRPPLERMEGADVWSLDWCPDAEWLIAIDGIAKTQTVLDHHHSSIKEIEEAFFPYFDNVNDYCTASELNILNPTAIVLDQTRSGVGLTGYVVQRWLGIKPPEFMAHIEDRDLWRWELGRTKNIVAAIGARPMTIEAWDDIFAVDGLTVLDAEGRAINTYRDELIERVASTYVWVALVDDEEGERWVVPCASSPYMTGSDVAGKLAEVEGAGGVGAYVILHADHVQFGLRSTDDGPDVAAIAERYGGGGHVHASGFTVSYEQFGRMVCAE
jgi:hypothetical protein